MARECTICKYFTGYYTKGYCCFYRTSCGHCRILNQTVDKHHTCESFKYRNDSRFRELKKGAILEAMSHAITDINAIKTILEERDLTE